MFIKNVKIKNFKGFRNFNNGEGVDLLYPESTEESVSLNILIGENNSGKTNFIDALSKIGSKKGKFVVEDWNVENKKENVVIEAISFQGETYKLEGKEQQAKIHTDGSNIFDGQMEIVKDQRVWTAKYNLENSLEHEKYLTQSSFDRTSIDNQLSHLLAKIEGGEDKQKFTEVFRKIIDDFNDWGGRSYAKSGDVITYKLSNGEYFDIDMSLGSGLLNLFRIVAAIHFDKKVIVIDEPEAFLHPSAQIKLSKLLVEESRKRQIIISTHSPYMYQSALHEKACLIQFQNEKERGISAVDVTTDGWGLFGGSSPTWGEVNYFVYDLPTIEFHNELYGFTKAQAYSRGFLGPQKTFDDWLLDEIKREDASVTKRDWYEIEGGQKAQTPKKVTSQTFIRHTIHHPENSYNPPYQEEELRRSTNQLVTVAKQFK